MLHRSTTFYSHSNCQLPRPFVSSTNVVHLTEKFGGMPIAVFYKRHEKENVSGRLTPRIPGLKKILGQTELGPIIWYSPKIFIVLSCALNTHKDVEQ